MSTVREFAAHRLARFDRVVLTLQEEAVFPSQMLRLAGFVCFTGLPSHRVDRHEGL